MKALTVALFLIVAVSAAVAFSVFVKTNPALILAPPDQDSEEHILGAIIAEDPGIPFDRDDVTVENEGQADKHNAPKQDWRQSPERIEAIAKAHIALYPEMMHTLLKEYEERGLADEWLGNGLLFSGSTLSDLRMTMSDFESLDLNEQVRLGELLTEATRNVQRYGVTLKPDLSLEERDALVFKIREKSLHMPPELVISAIGASDLLQNGQFMAELKELRINSFLLYAPLMTEVMNYDKVFVRAAAPNGVGLEDMKFRQDVALVRPEYQTYLDSMAALQIEFYDRCAALARKYR